MASLADKKVDYQKLELSDLLGEGSYAKVFKATYRGEMVAVKQIKRDAQDFGEFRKEIWAMR